MTFDEQLALALYACAPRLEGGNLRPLMDALNAMSNDCNLPHYADGHFDHLEDVSNRVFIISHTLPFRYYVVERCRVCGHVGVRPKSSAEKSR